MTYGLFLRREQNAIQIERETRSTGRENTQYRVQHRSCCSLANNNNALGATFDLLVPDVAVLCIHCSYSLRTPNVSLVGLGSLGLPSASCVVPVSYSYSYLLHDTRRSLPLAIVQRSIFYHTKRSRNASYTKDPSVLLAHKTG